MTGLPGTLPEAMSAFGFSGAAVRYGSGHVNDTFLVSGPQGRHILQRLSPAAFRRPGELMRNLFGVTEYLAAKVRESGGDPKRECLTLLRPLSGEDYFTDSLGGAWRAMLFIPGTVTCESDPTPEIFAASGRAFGRFQRLMDGYPADTLFETIPGFHGTPARLRRLLEAAGEDKLGRAKDAAAEIDFAIKRRDVCGTAIDALERGELPLRVTHNDTKLDNVLLDAKTGEALCVVDLDTVMPGSAIYDFGDSIRFGANHCREDERDLSRVELDLELFRVYTRAFLEGAGGALTDREVEYLPWGALLMTLECGIRFLTDHLEGDVYFRLHRPGQNLDRARTQFKLVSSMEAHWREMEDICRSAANI